MGRRRRPAVDVRTAEVDDIPVRILSQAIERDDGTYVVQIVGERPSSSACSTR
jgi:hypothetical protein